MSSSRLGSNEKYISTLSARNSANKSDRLTPRMVMDSSSNSDMMELKMALGGSAASDRSGSKTRQQDTILNQLFEGNDVIFSDEGSEDSFVLDD